MFSMIRKLLLPALCLVPGVAHAEWHEASSEHFVIYANESPDQIKAFATRLERFDKAVRSLLVLPERNISPNSRVTVYVVDNIDEVQKAAHQAGDVAGFYQDGDPSGPFAFVPKHANDYSDSSLNNGQILQHEYTHHLMYSSWPSVVFPVWFSEGFAELFATAHPRSDGSVVIGEAPLYRRYGMDQENIVPIDRLVTSRPNYHDDLEAQVFYGRSWLLMHYLIFDKDRVKQLANYIVAINQGKSPAEAAKTIDARPALDLKLNAYGSKMSLPIAAVAASKLGLAPVTVRALTPGESAVMPALLRSKAGVDPKAAGEVVVLARQLSAPFPNDPGAQNELAEAEYDSGNYALSEAAADRALAADPKSMHATIYKGMAEMALAKQAKATDPNVWATARRYYLAANKLDPLYSWPIQLYYESFGEARQAPSKAAQDGLLYAYQLRPDNMSLRLETAHVLLAQGNIAAARVALEPIAFSPHEKNLADTARKVIAAIDASGAAAGLAALDAPPARKPDDKADGKKGSDKQN